ncbi:glycosyltransferase family 2 protein [Aromatoleum diolicum]|uniref:Glycosyltransferase n=1 Tax=Aromatoleum diolicum TaxID=75796 RepID=A0ABX1QIC4_9RHOO|nr:glycosyltransferase [Aromatoleum diolicum]NMG77266.1 glycosyltransferase [Aromatoleum diolicum]
MTSAEGDPTSEIVLNPLISFCITTFNRGEVVRETLQCLLEQAGPGVEVVVVDAGTDGSCARIAADLSQKYDALRYFFRAENSGLDRDFCHAVELATGEYCWLFSDDDLIRPGAVDRVRSQLADKPALVITNAAVYGPDLSRVLQPAMMVLSDTRTLRPDEQGELLRVAGQCLSFIGSVVIRRDIWLARDPRPYWGTMFVHVGMIFQARLPGPVRLLAHPEVLIRYGVGSWKPRQFEIWMKLWPDLIWSFDGLPDSAKAAVVARRPSTKLRSLLLYRAKRAYDIAGFHTIVAKQTQGPLQNFAARTIARLPSTALRLAAILYIRLFQPHATLDLVDLAAAGGRLARLIAGSPGRAG